MGPRRGMFTMAKMDVEGLYAARFDPEEIERKNEIWKVLCQDFFQKYVERSDAVLDLGAGYCEFINNIQCREKHALDLNEDTQRLAHPDVRVHLRPSTDLSSFPEGSINVVFCSNFFEHLEREQISATLAEIHRILAENGQLLILQPNVKYLYKDFWDFFDHRTPLSHLSMMEVLRSQGFVIKEVMPRFLPYTTKSAFPQNPILVKAYLRIPLLYRIFGKQMFIVAGKMKP